MVIFFLLLLFTSPNALADDPWGKDSALVKKSTFRPKESPTDPFQQAILFHQTILSQADGPRSHFYPSSSEYGKQALTHWGIQTGLLLTFDRLMREHNERWLYSVAVLPSKVKLKYDPIPVRAKKVSKKPPLPQ